MCRTSGIRRQTQSFITVTYRPAGNLIGGLENRCESRHTRCYFHTLLTPAADVGNGRESGTHYCQPYVVRFTALLFLCYPRVLSGRVLLKLFLELRPRISSLGRYVPSFMAFMYFQRFRQDKVSLDVKLSQVMEWIDLPLSERPQLILGTSWRSGRVLV